MNPHNKTSNTTKNNNNDNLEPPTSLSQRWLAACAHELRIPVAQIDASAAILLNDAGNGGLNPSERQAFIEDILAANKSLNSLIEDCIAFAKGKQTDFPVTCETIDLYALLSQLHHSFVGQMHDGAVLNFEYDKALPKQVLGDPQRIIQCTANLLRNAIKFTESGSITLQVTKPNNDELHICINDTGIGISPDKIHSIWDAFTKVHSNEQDAIMERDKGLGLGLAIVSQFVQQMGGKVNVESELNVGSTFRFSLQLAP